MYYIYHDLDVMLSDMAEFDQTAHRMQFEHCEVIQCRRCVYVVPKNVDIIPPPNMVWRSFGSDEGQPQYNHRLYIDITFDHMFIYDRDHFFASPGIYDKLTFGMSSIASKICFGRYLSSTCGKCGDSAACVRSRCISCTGKIVSNSRVPDHFNTPVITMGANGYRCKYLSVMAASAHPRSVFQLEDGKIFTNNWVKLMYNFRKADQIMMMITHPNMQSSFS